MKRGKLTHMSSKTKFVRINAYIRIVQDHGGFQHRIISINPDHIIAVVPDEIDEIKSYIRVCGGDSVQVYRSRESVEEITNQIDACYKQR
jgi:glycogen synthase